MFKLLVADDEVFTREGITEQISFKEMNISDVRQAYDGINALEICSGFTPDILLTDVRMPRMDGIELANKLREINPYCEIIFMSGYSDKEYLKSAIKLKAVSYVEKPIDLEELEVALKSAVLSKSKETKLNERIKKDLALQLIDKDINIDELKLLLKGHQFTDLNTANISTLLIRLIGNAALNRAELMEGVSKILSKNNLNSVSCFKDSSLMLIHLYGSEGKKQLFRQEKLIDVFTELSQYLDEHCSFFICAGKTVKGLQAIYESYETAVQALNKTFFYQYNSIIFYHHIKRSSFVYDESFTAYFNELLVKEDKHQLIMHIKGLTSSIKESTGTSVNYAKDIYYKLYLELERFALERKLALTQATEDKKSSFEIFAAFFTIFEAEDYLIEKLKEVFNSLAKKDMEADPASVIMNFIHNNYGDADLSLQDISRNTYLSVAYICTIFKESTGKTINKYIAEYRLKKSKELLRDQGIRITDIAAKVGYSDGNYFTKTFKKETDLTPSEYRKKYL